MREVHHLAKKNKTANSEFKKLKTADLVEKLASGFYPFDQNNLVIPAAARSMTKPFDMRLIRYSDGSLSEIQVDERNVVKLLNQDEYRSAIKTYLNWCQSFWPEERLIADKYTTDQIHYSWKYGAVEATDFSRNEPIILSEDDIAPVLFKSQEGYCWHRLPFDPVEGYLGLWIDVADRMTNWPSFLAWLGSLFDPDSNREQFIWIVGEGETGKSTLIDVLLGCFGPSAMATNCEAADERWFVSDLVGRRIAYIDEAKAGFVKGAKIKTLTGNSKQRCEAKYQSAKTVTINTKFIFSSNEFPDIPNKKEYLRRIILCEMSAITDKTMTRTEAEEGYRRGLPALFHEALNAWEQSKGSHKIASDQESILDYAGQSDTDAELSFQKFFVRSPGNWVSSGDIYGKLQDTGLKKFEIHRLLKDWQRIFGIKYEITGSGNQRIRGYRGLAKRGI
jgi:hypothetical protein